MVKSCLLCQRHQELNAKEPLLPRDVPQKAWPTLWSDIFYWNNTYYLLVTDYYSHQQSLHTSSLSLKNMGSAANLLQTTVPITHLLASKPEFSHSFGFRHVTSSSLYFQSNGLIERTVQIVKDLQKCKESGQDPHMAMLRLHSTPLSHDLPSLENS